MMNYQKKYWEEILDDKAIIINGHCFHILPNNSLGVKGFSGAKFKIELFDRFDMGDDTGEAILVIAKRETTNLWHNGKVPKELNIKDNARFAKDSPTTLTLD